MSEEVESLEVINLVVLEDGSTRAEFYCPGCKSKHSPTVKDGNWKGATWDFNNDLIYPTLKPILSSAFIDRGKKVECHAFVKDGKIKFTKDSDHELAGETVELKPIEK